jgi:uncharacterized protein YjbJ (UPF0337 family)
MRFGQPTAAAVNGVEAQVAGAPVRYTRNCGADNTTPPFRARPYREASGPEAGRASGHVLVGCSCLERNPTRGNIMGEHNSGPEEAVKGVVEDVKGKAKEVVGAVTGRDDIQREGQAQQDKAEAQRDVAKKEAEAEAARGAAKTAEGREKAEQN